MNSNLITTIVLTIIGSGIIAPFSKSIFDKIFAAYNPDPKKINSGIKKGFLFTLRYLLPIANLIYVYVSHKAVDKYLVLTTAFIFSMLVLNILTDIFFRFIDKIYLNDRDLIKDIVSILEKQQGVHESTISALNSLTDLQKKNTKFINKLSTEKHTDVIKGQNDENQQKNNPDFLTGEKDF